MKRSSAHRARQAYLDGELDVLGSVRFEGHLAACPRCRMALDGEHAVHDALAGSGLYAPATSELTGRIAQALDRESTRSIKPGRMRALRVPQWAALAATIAVLAAGALVPPLLRQPTREASLAAQVVDAHVRSLQAGHLTDVASSDQHTVKPWFAGRLDFSPPVVDLAAEGFPLVGGRLDVMGGRPVAALAYSRGRHVLNVFVWPETPPEASVSEGTLRGYAWYRSSHGGMTIWAVSDGSAADLETLVRALAR